MITIIHTHIGAKLTALGQLFYRSNITLRNHMNRQRFGQFLLRLQYWCEYLEVLWSACLSVCPLAYRNNHTSKFHQIFCTYYLWPWLGPPLDGNRIFYVLPALWMTSCFHIMEQIGQNQIRSMFCWVHQVAAPAQSMPSATASCCPQFAK